jgi:hypothetical protein
MIFEINGQVSHSTNLLRHAGTGGTVVFVTRDYSRVFVRERHPLGGFRVREATTTEIHGLVQTEGLEVLRKVTTKDT